jgi:hypothetical protein
MPYFNVRLPLPELCSGILIDNLFWLHFYPRPIVLLQASLESVSLATSRSSRVRAAIPAKAVASVTASLNSDGGGWKVTSPSMSHGPTSWYEPNDT